MKRKCYAIFDQNFVKGRGFIIGSIPWYRGMAKEAAQRAADAANRQSFGIDPDEARDIIISSMRAGRVER